MNKKTIFTFAFALLGLASFAQKLPDWITNKPTPTNSTYLYVVESATGQTSIGKAKIRKAANLYNNGRMYSQSNLEMEYGLTGNGAYVTLSF